MSLITSCPACGTMFRVVPDQLKISEGWVRCGHCSEVFDATAHLGEEGAVAMPASSGRPGPAVTPPASPHGAFTHPAAVSRAAVQPPAATPTQQPSWPAPATAAPADRASAPPPATAAPLPPDPLEDDPSPGVPAAGLMQREDPGDSHDLEESPLDEPFVFRRSDLVDDDPLPSVSPPLAPPGQVGLAHDDDEDAELEDVSFVRQARRKAFWSRPLVRLALSLAALALAALLALQVAVHQPERLAAAQPALAPVLQRLCGTFGCRLGPPRQIDAIVIESSGFNRLRNDTYRLSFTLRNTAPMVVEAPAMELTLTDSQDQPVLRRVLTPAELGAADGALAPSSEWSGALGLVVAGNGLPRVAGYRLLAFYP